MVLFSFLIVRPDDLLIASNSWSGLTYRSKSPVMRSFLMASFR